MKKIDPNNHSMKMALLNEYKGNLFEFRVGLNLARLFLCEDLFLFNLNEELKSRLEYYEDFIRSFDFELLKKLDDLAKETSEAIFFELKDESYKLLEIHLIGKSVATNSNQLWSESDLVLVGEGDQIRFLSLKLSKDKSFTNTKSAGVKSFIEKYFKPYPSSHLDQLCFNQIVDEAFYQMGVELYELKDLVFKGQFGAEWKDHYTELPGELDNDSRDALYTNYARLNHALYSQLERYYQSDSEAFLKCLYSLIGHSHSEMTQIVCFHQNHEFKNCEITHFKDLECDSNEFRLLPFKEKSHSLEIEFPKIILQLRIKPMNKFTTASYKVNCSIKKKRLV
jgi:hypothetical protein